MSSRASEREVRASSLVRGPLAELPLARLTLVTDLSMVSMDYTLTVNHELTLAPLTPSRSPLKP